MAYFWRALTSRTAVLLAAIAFLGHAAAAQDGTVRLNPNTVTATELAELDTLSPDVAKAILDARPFERTSEFDALMVKLVENDERVALYERLFLPVELNTATRDELAIIPGMSGRMIREFEEYRPYKDLEQFNREIGKYVDEVEVTRLRSYVSLDD
ncbi:MAG: hypothetical protein WBB25_04395 [Sulfitobacter sp.]